VRIPRRTALAFATALTGLVALAGCGVPRDDAPRVVAAGQIDPRLLAESSPTGTPNPAGSSFYQVAFVTADDELLRRRRPVAPGPAFQQVAQLLTALQAGPDDGEHDRGLSTALPSDARLRLASLASREAVVAIEGGTKDADPRRLPLSVAQVVLTLTSHPAVKAVVITRDGQLVEAPLPGGELIHRPLTAADYESLLAGRASPSPSVSARTAP